MRADRQFLGKTRTYSGLDRLGPPRERINSWGSLYSRKFLIDRQVWFDEEQQKFEDRLFVVDSTIKAEKIAVFAQPVRVWRRRANSITTSSKTLRESFMKLALFEKCVSRWIDSGLPNSEELAIQEFVRHCKNILFQHDVSTWTLLDHNENGCINSGAIDLQARLKAFFNKLPISADQLERAFPLSDPARSDNETTNARITVTDFHDFIIFVRNGDFVSAMAIVRRASSPPPVPLASPMLERSAPPLERIYLHLGLHKTGTTYLQNAMDGLREQLKSEGLLFPKTGLGFSREAEPVRPSGLPGHQGLLGALRDNDTGVVQTLHDEIAQSGCPRMLISAENMVQYPRGPSSFNLNQIGNVLVKLGFGQVPVVPILSYRRPDRWVEAYYRELTGNGAPVGYQSPDEYLNNNSFILDLPRIAEEVERQTKARLRIFSFDSALANGGLASTFLYHCDVPRTLRAEADLQEGTRYASACNAQIAVAQQIGALVKNQDRRQTLLRSFFALTKATNQRGPIMSKRARQRAIDLFEGFSGSYLRERDLPAPFREWREDINIAGDPKPLQIPQQYLDTIARIGTWTDVIIGEGCVAVTKEDVAVTRDSSVPVSKAIDAADIFSSEVVQRYPRPVRAFIRGYFRLTHNKIYRKLRHLNLSEA